MALWLDGGFWSRYFREVFVRDTDAFYRAVLDRLLPAFNDIDEEAERVAEAEFERLGSMPASGDGNFDMGDVAERALEAGIVYYQTFRAIRQAMLNLSAVALYHMVEQHLLLFHRKQVLSPSEEHNIRKLSLGQLIETLKCEKLDLTSLGPWPKIDELRLLANAVKHAEGRSSQQLKKLRRDLFVPPSTQGEGRRPVHPVVAVYLPLAGEDIYVTLADLQKYRSAIVQFWEEFGDALRAHNQT